MYTIRFVHYLSRDFVLIDSIITLIQKKKRKTSYEAAPGYMACIAYPRPRLLWQSCNLLVEKLLGLLPDARILAVLELKQAWHQSFAEHLGALTGKKRREVINADHTEGCALAAAWQAHRYCGLIEGGGDVVDRDRVVGVRAIDSFSSSSWRFRRWDPPYVSALTSQITDKRRLGVSRLSTFTTGAGISNHSTKQLLRSDRI